MYCFADVILLHYGSVWEGHFFNGFQEIAKHFNYDPQVEKICTTFFLFLLLPTIGFSALEAMPKYEFARKELLARNKIKIGSHYKTNHCDHYQS